MEVDTKSNSATVTVMVYSNWQDFVSELVKARKERGWSQTKAAKLAGIGVMTVRRIEEGHTNISLRSWFRYTETLNLKSKFDFIPK